MKSHLPFTYRDGLTIDSGEYKQRTQIELVRLREKSGSLKKIIRLETILGMDVSSSDDFEIASFMSADGHAIKYNKWKFEDAGHVFIFLNGLESHVGWFDEMADTLAAEGIRTYGLDRRGSGLNSRISGKFQDWIDDVKTLTKIAGDENPTAKKHLVSLCFGAKVAAACAVQEPGCFDSMIFFSPGLSVKVAPTPKEKLLIGLDRIPGLYFNVRTPIKNDYMFTSEGKALYFLFKDRLRTHSPRASDFYQAFMVDRYISKNLDKITTPSLALFGGNDKVVNVRKTTEFLRKFSQKPKTVEYPNSDHVIFFGGAKDEMIRDMLNFIISEI